jgi:hypothetical protein
VTANLRGIGAHTTVASGPVTPPLLATHALHDLLFVHCACYGAQTLTIDQGYVLLDSYVVGNAAEYLFWKFDGGSEVAPTVSGSGAAITATVFDVYGQSQAASPWDAAFGHHNSGTDTTAELGALTTLTDGALALGVIASAAANHWDPAGCSYGNLSGGLVNNYAVSTGTNKCSQAFICGRMPTAGSIGTPYHTESTLGPTQWVSLVGSIRPYAAPPAVAGLSPATASTAGGDTVVITGTGFSNASAVVFGATPATSFTVDSATQITAVSPAHSAATIDVTVTTPEGTSATGAADHYTFQSSSAYALTIAAVVAAEGYMSTPSPVVPVLAVPIQPALGLGDLAVLPAQTVVVACSAFLGGAWQADLHVTTGSVTADSRRTAMRDASITVAPDATLSHDDLYELLGTPGLQLQISRGFQLPDETQVVAPLGTFIVDQLTYKRTAAGSDLSATCTDLSEIISKARWTQPYQIAAGVALSDAINAAALDRWPAVVSGISTDTVPNVLGAQAVFEAGSDSDPWADLYNLAASFGWLLYFSPDGILSAESTTYAATASPVFTFATGVTAIMTSQSKVVAADQTYNGVIVTGESSANDNPPRGEAWDLNPASPTYLGGPFGSVPMFYSSPMITTADQATTVAAAMLAGCLGKTETLSWEQVVHPGLQPLDVVAAQFIDGTTVSYLLDSLTIPLSVSDVMTASARSTLAPF